MKAKALCIPPPDQASTVEWRKGVISTVTGFAWRSVLPMRLLRRPPHVRR